MTVVLRRKNPRHMHPLLCGPTHGKVRSKDSAAYECFNSFFPLATNRSSSQDSSVLYMFSYISSPCAFSCMSYGSQMLSCTVICCQSIECARSLRLAIQSSQFASWTLKIGMLSKQAHLYVPENENWPWKRDALCG